jgi:hypothetical protein
VSGRSKLFFMISLKRIEMQMRVRIMMGHTLGWKASQIPSM